MRILLISASIGFVLRIKQSHAFSVNVLPKSFHVHKNTHLHATWSDNRAVQEYKDFLSSGLQEIKQEKDGPCVIVKSADFDTELPDAIFKMGMGNDIILIAGEELPALVGDEESYPIYVTVPPHQLRDFLKDLPESYADKRDDFVFCSGGLKYGNIEHVLKDFGLARDTMTQFLITGIDFSTVRPLDRCVKLGVDAGGTDKWAGECAACGKWQGAIAERLERSDIRCKVNFYREWRRLMWERIMMDAVFNLVGSVRVEPTTVQQVALYYEEEVSDMLWTISGLLRGSRAITLTYGFEERMFGVAETIKEQCVLIDHMYPFLYEPFQSVPSFLEYMSYAQDERGLLSTATFPRGSIDNNKSIIRPGNLRADGVI